MAVRVHHALQLVVELSITAIQDLTRPCFDQYKGKLIMGAMAFGKVINKGPATPTVKDMVENNVFGCNKS